MTAENYICFAPSALEVLRADPALAAHVQQCVDGKRFELLTTSKSETDPLWIAARARTVERLNEIPVAQRMVAEGQVKNLKISGIAAAQCTYAILAGAHTLVSEDVTPTTELAQWLRVLRARDLTQAYPDISKGFTLD